MKQSDAAVQTKPYNLDANQTMIGLGMSLEPIMRSGKIMETVLVLTMEDALSLNQ